MQQFQRTDWNEIPESLTHSFFPVTHGCVYIHFELWVNWNMCICKKLIKYKMK